MMTFPLSGIMVQVVISVCCAAEIHSPFPVREGEELLAWPDAGAQILSEGLGQSCEMPLVWLGTVPAFDT